MSDSNRPGKGMKTNHSIAKAVALLRGAARAPDGASVTTLAAHAGLPRATASRLLATLDSQGLVQRLADNDRYTLGYELVRLARAVNPDRALVLATRPTLERLAAEFRETVTLAVPTPGPGYNVVCQIDAPRAIRAHDWSIDPQPLHATSTGKLVLTELTPTELHDALRGGLTRLTAATIVNATDLRAELEHVRRQGWAQMVDELEDGLTGISVPLRDHQHKMTAAVGITAPTQRMSPRQRAAVADTLKASIAELSPAAVVTPPAPADA
ncbi:MAG: IclR family transcriptional regulator [Solirubrobacteraceae bacterium]